MVLFGVVLLSTLGTRFRGRKMIRVLTQQASIDRPAHHPPRLMTEPFDFRKRRIARGPVFAKAPLRQHRHQLVELRSLSRRELQILILISSFLAHDNLLSINPIFPSHTRNLTCTPPIRHPSFRNAATPPQPVPAPLSPFDVSTAGATG
jgi:hypothetical protein